MTERAAYVYPGFLLHIDELGNVLRGSLRTDGNHDRGAQENDEKQI
jgi:hypothetical protein